MVDDEQGIVDILKEFLSTRGYTVIGAYSGEEALEVLEKQKQDIVLLDIHMDGIQGSEVARIIKDKYPRTKIIIITGYPQQSQRLIRDSIPDDIFTKPFKLEMIYNRIDKLLRPAAPAAQENKDNVKAGVLLIRAKVLIFEPDPQAYSQISRHMAGLSHSGQHYVLEDASDLRQLEEKLISFHPDILVANSEFLKSGGQELFLRLCDEGLLAEEVVAYAADIRGKISPAELERAERAVQKTCFKKGLVEVEWLEI